MSLTPDPSLPPPAPREYGVDPIHLHPLAYLLGLEGVALMRAFAGEYDAGYARARIAEARALLDRADELGDGVEVPPLTAARGYDGWAPSYDSPDNPLFEMDEAVLLPWLRGLREGLAPGVAVDVACGTGRYAAHLAELGFEVSGYDASPGMLALAEAKVPGATFGLAPMDALPLPDASADVVVNTLALSHVRDLAPVFAEAARVLRPGGHLLVSDVRGYFVGSDRTPLPARDPEGNVGYLPSWHHPTSAYLQAALASGLVARRCEEPRYEVWEDEPATYDDPGTPPSIWALHTWAPAAAAAVMSERRCLVVWDFERE